MAGTKRISDVALTALLEKSGKRFDFFRAVDLVERVHEGTVPVGHAGPADREALRFEHDPELSFHTSDIRFIVPADPAAGRPFTRMRTTFLGLFGVVSPLPVTMSEDVLAADGNEQGSLREFYDLFHHRVLGLFFRAWQKHRLDASHRTDAADPFTGRALAFVGVDVKGPTPERGLPPLALLGLSPLFARRARSTDALKAVASRLLPGIPFDVECFVLRRTELRPEQRVTLGVRNTTLGNDFAIGRSVADRSGRFRVVLGPLTQQQAESVSPGGAQHATLRSLLAHFSGGVLEAEVEIVMAPEEVPRFCVGGSRGAVLGRSTRLGTTEPMPLRSRFLVSA